MTHLRNTPKNIKTWAIIKKHGVNEYPYIKVAGEHQQVTKKQNEYPNSIILKEYPITAHNTFKKRLGSSYIKNGRKADFKLRLIAEDRMIEIMEEIKNAPTESLKEKINAAKEVNDDNNI
jgi:hypothetical protein